MSPTPTDLAAHARRILEDAGRPLSVRRIHRLLPDSTAELDALRDALVAASEGDEELVEVRRGIYSLGAEAPRAERAPPPVDEPAKRRRRRRTRPSDMVGDDPPTSLTVEDAVAEAESATDRDALRRSLWEKMRASAAAVVARPPSADDSEPPAPGAPAEDGADDVDETDAAPPQVEATPAPPAPKPALDRDAMKEALKARLQTRRHDQTRSLRPSKTPSAAPAPAALATSESELDLPKPTGGRKPYVERRVVEADPPEADRRDPALPEISPTNALVAAALGTLRDTGTPLPLEALTARVGDQGLTTSGLRAAVLAENARRSRSGLRAPFVIGYSGAVGLSEWGLSARYRTLEASIQAAMAEQREIVRRDLLARVGELSDRAFEQVVVMLLEQLGYENVSIVHRQRGSVALSAGRDEGGGPESTAVVARRSWSSMKPDTVRALRDSLEHFGAGRGLLISMGTFTRAARREASLGDRAVVRLVDGAGLARLLYEHGVGLASHQPLMRFVDVAFFESLE